MKFFPKLLTALFLIVFIVELFGFLFILLIPNLSQAANTVQFKPQITVGNIVANKGKDISPTSIGEYIREIYKYAIGAVGILAAVVLMVGGIIWLTSGGNQTRVGEAKSYIAASLTGLIIALCSYLILATINPELVKIKSIDPKEPALITTGSCRIAQATQSGNTFYCENNLTEEACEGGANPRGTWTKGGECPGCCAWIGTDIINSCTYDIAAEKCKASNNIFFSQTQCDKTAGCPQYCAKKSDYSDCGNNGKSAVCVSGQCRICETSGNMCTIDICCSGLCCDGVFGTCISGNPTNGKYCN